MNNYQNTDLGKIIDKTVSEWTLATGHPLTETEISSLVDKLAATFDALVVDEKFMGKQKQ